MKKVILILVVLANLAFSTEELTQTQIEYLDKECESGDSPICVGLGDSYLFGFGNSGLNKDYKKAKFYFEKVCKEDKNIKQDEYSLEACLNLGLMYQDGFGVKPNYKKAFELYSIACDGGLTGACSNIGFMYEKGQGVQRDIVKGAAYYRRACDKGDVGGCRNFASYLYNYGDKSKAAEYLKKACDLGRDDYSTQNYPEYKSRWQKSCDMYDILK
nr:tetratricopeptide repeat protein [uncultured Campylobacter sp.]